MKASFVTIILSVILTSSAFAHGMNKPGPHNGYVRMPGTYHVELVSDQNVLKVYFLDMNFKPLAIDTATAKITLKGFKEESLTCKKETEFYTCDTKNVNMKKYKEVLVTSSKAGEKEVTSKFNLPLSFN